MGEIQNAINQAISSAGTVAGIGKIVQKTSKSTELQEKADKRAEELAKAEAEKEQKTLTSYGNALAEKLSAYQNPDNELNAAKLPEPNEFWMAAAEKYDETKKAMAFQRNNWRLYRDSFTKDSPEWRKAEEQGQANKQTNIENFERDLSYLYQNIKNKQNSSLSIARRLAAKKKGGR